MNSNKDTRKQGQWAKWTGAAVAALLVAQLFRGSNDWGQTVQTPKVDPAVANKIDAPAVPMANKLMQLAGFNNNGKFTLNGTVPSDAIKVQIDVELKKTFGENNYINNLTVAADVKPAGWLTKLSGLFDLFKVSGAEVTFNGETLSLSGTAGSLSEKLQAFLGDGFKVSTLDIANASKAATGNALDTLNALKPDASGKEILDALNLQIINFASGSAVIPAENQAVLKKAATLLKDKKDFTFEIGGHADNVGNEAANLTLSERRAAAVRDFLIKNGVANTMLTAKGYGSNIPVADNTTEAGRFKNRRIEYR